MQFNDHLKHFILTLVVSLAGLGLLHAQESRFSIAPRIGYGVQDMDWSIAGNLDGTGPNILSELIWDNVRGSIFGLDGTVRIIPNLELILEGDYQKNVSGRARDTDYYGDNRTNAYYDEHFSSTEGYFYTIRAGGRYTFPNFGPISPRLFLAYEQMGNELFLLPLPDDRENRDLRTTYQTDWYGGQAGLELACQLDLFYALGSYGFGIYDYQSKANWNLIDDFQQPVSFRHFATGFKHTGTLRVGYELTRTLSVELTGIYHYAFTNSGLDELYTRNEGTLTTRFNGAKLTHYSGSLGLRLNF